MVKKKGKSKRIAFKDKYKIEKRIAETHRKRKKQAKRDAANGVIRHDLKAKKKDPGIPNSWPFKQDLLKEIQRTRERQQQQQLEAKQKRQEGLKALREHQAAGGTARTVQELMQQASQDQDAFHAKQQQDALLNENANGDSDIRVRSDGKKAAGQQSRRAYLRELKKVIDSADVILQVLDARDPMSSRIHPTIEDAILSKVDKRMVLVLNKIDLVPKEVVSAWLTTLRRAHPTIAIKANHVFQSTSSSNKSAGKDDDDHDMASTTTATTSHTPLNMDSLLQLLKNYARTDNGKTKTTISVGVIGYPNVGKSSIINALKRTRAVGVSPRPGFTTSMQEVVLDKTVRLIDSPGVVFDDRSALLGNCIDAESMDDPIPPVAALLKRCNHESLLMTYNLPAFSPIGDVMMFLAMVAKCYYGRVLKGGIPDKMAAARAVLKDWNQGKIPYYTVPPKNDPTSSSSSLSKPVVENDAVIVSEFGKEFDVMLAQYDRAVLGSLKDDRDEMDFIQLQEQQDDDDNENGTAMVQDKNNIAGAAATAAFLSRDNGQDDDDEEAESMDEDDEEEDDDHAPSRAQLASAENFDFDAM